MEMERNNEHNTNISQYYCFTVFKDGRVLEGYGTLYWYSGQVTKELKGFESISDLEIINILK